MSCWYAIPSIRPVAEAQPVIDAWAQKGYRVALLRQGEEIPFNVRLQIPTEHYHGWAASVNLLCREIIERDKQAEWICTGGDDYFPDPDHTAEEIAAECGLYFAKLHAGPEAAPGVAISVRSIGAALRGLSDHTFGVMQPVGDRWGEDPHQPNHSLRGAYIDRICGSPWMGREFCRRMYGGRGPLFDGYHHMYADEELFEVATKLGVLWQRRDLMQYHAHALRKRNANLDTDLPDFLKPVNTDEHWEKSKRLFDSRKANGWPGHEPI